MSAEATAGHVRERVEALYRTESRRVLATLIRLLGDFDAAEEALHDAFAVALEQWPTHGVPANPYAWLVSAGRFQAIDRLRRRATFDVAVVAMREPVDASVTLTHDVGDEHLRDDQLRLIFVCCHPALPSDAQVALTLREVCGLTTEAIARAFLTSPATVAQRIVRAKGKIRDAQIPYEVPTPAELPDRLDAVLRVIYLVFNEGYAVSHDDALTRQELTREAIRLGRLLVELLPDPEVMGLLALMLLHDARRAARSTAGGQLVLLSEQDRTRWNRSQIAEGLSLVERALRSRRIGPYALQAAIAALHAEAPNPEETDWDEIVGLYDVLLRLEPSPVVALNRAAAVAVRDGAAAGLMLIDMILADGALADYSHAHAARADCLRRLGRLDDAAAAYDRASSLTTQRAEREFLDRRRRECGP